MSDNLSNKSCITIFSILVALFSIVTYLVIHRSREGDDNMPDQKAVDSLFVKFWDWRMQESPEFGTFIGNHTYDHKLESYALEAFERRKQACESFISEAQKLLSNPDLDSKSRENLKLFIAELTTYVNGFGAKGYLFPINRMEGVHIELSRLVSSMEYKAAEDYQKLISRLKSVPMQIDEIISLMKEGIKLNMTNHEVSMKDVLTQLDELQTEVEVSSLYKPVLSMPDSIDASMREEIHKETKKVLSELVLPSFQKLRTFLEMEYSKHLRPDIGVSTIPNGEKFYRMCLQFHLGFDISPEEVHQMGLKEVERIEKDMMQVIKKLGLNLSLKEFSEKLLDKSNFFTSENEVLEEYKDIVFNRIRPKLPSIIKNIPKAKISIEPTPPAMASGPGAYYLGGTPDGKPGVFYVNTHRLDCNPKHNMMTLALHEAEPGHHLQWSYLIELENIPSFRQYVEDRKYSDAPSRFPLHTSYLEGWGLYCEYLGYELGLYQDPYLEFGHLSYEMFRACRLVVDTGIHAFGWDREKAINFMVEKTAMHRGELENEVDRYITWPGQACGYKVGQLKIKELRSKATKTLGSKFDVREFHDIVLRSAGPLSLLEQNVDEYIKVHGDSS